MKSKRTQVGGPSAAALAFAAMASAGAAGAATAPEPAAAPGGTVSEVVVTAQFREQRLQDIPIAITALTGAALEQKNAVDLVSAGNLAPNVSLSRNALGFGQVASIFIRGVGQADPHFAQEPGVGVYVDDVYYGVLPGAIFQLMDTDRVEISRGPQGTLSGKNSIGGSIKLYSKRPGPESDGYVEATYGSYNLIGGKAASSFTVVPDRLYARIAVSGRRTSGYFDRLDYGCATGTISAGTQRLSTDCKIGSAGGEAIWTARASLRWIVNDRIENTLIADIAQDTSENPAAKTMTQSPLWAGSANYITCARCYTSYETYNSRPTATGPGEVPFQMPLTTPLDAKGAANLLNIEISPSLRLESITGYRTSVVTFSTVSEGTPASISDQIWRLAHKQFTQELRLSGTVGEFANWTVGGFYYSANGTSGGRVNIPGGLALGGGGLDLDILFRDPVKTRSESAFAHVELHPLERLTLTFGGRYTKDSKKFTFNRWDIAGRPHPVLGALVNFPVEYKGDRFDYRANLDYRFSDELMAYAQISTGYKGGGVNPRPFFVSQALPYDPETLTAYEVGFKSQFFDRRLIVNGAGFINKYKNFQGTLLNCDAFSPFPGAPCAMTANVGDADIKGVEFEVQLRPVRGLTIDAAVGGLDFKYTRVNLATGISFDMTNIYTPSLTASAGVQYEFDLGKMGTLTPRVDLTYRSAIQTQAINTPLARIGALGLANAKITWRNPTGWAVDVAVQNLGDRFYYNSIFDQSNAPYFARTGNPAQPRTASVTVRRSF